MGNHSTMWLVVVFKRGEEQQEDLMSDSDLHKAVHAEQQCVAKLMKLDGQ